MGAEDAPDVFAAFESHCRIRKFASTRLGRPADYLRSAAPSLDMLSLTDRRKATVLPQEDRQGTVYAAQSDTNRPCLSNHRCGG